MPEFIRDLAANDLLNRRVGSPDNLLEGYNKGSQFILNKHALASSRIVSLRKNTSWYSDDLVHHKIVDASFNI